MPGNASGAVVVTGASTGIGRATALFLDRQGYRVFAAVRKQADADELAKAASDRLTPTTIDVADEQSISWAKEEVSEALGEEGLAGLVNNAGVAAGGPIEFMPIEDFRSTLEVNLVGQVAVTQAFLSLIRKAKGTVVFIASIGGRVASPFLSPYHASKFGIEALGESLRHELRPWDIDVVVEPGVIDTKIWAKGEDILRDRLEKMPPKARRLYGKQFARFGEATIREATSRGISPEKVAKVIHKAIASDGPRHRYLVGTDAKIGARLKGTLPDRTFSKLIGRQLKLPEDVPSE